jgi:hypothetical protein
VTVCSSARARRPAGWGSLVVGAVAALLAAGPLPRPAAADHWKAPSTVFVERTGHTADRLFLDVWREQRGVLGDPITEEFDTRTGFANRGDGGLRAQFFENLAIYYDPDAPVGEQVVPLDLGAQALADRLAARPSAALLRADRRTVCGGGGECRGFVASGHTLRGPFLDWWTDNEGEQWLGDPLTEAFRAPDGSLVQYFEFGALRKRAAGGIAPLPLGRIVARQQGISTDPIPRPEDVPVFSPALFVEPPVSEDDLIAHAPAAPALPENWVAPAIPVGWITGSFGPGPQQGGYKEIVVSVSQQAAWAYEGGELMMSSMVSTGTAEIPETVTPVGFHSVLTKYETQTMEGFIGGEDYKVENVPHILYFDNLGNAIHGAYWHSNFGTPMSHGCVNLPLDAAAWLFSWADVGTAVTVVS